MDKLKDNSVTAYLRGVIQASDLQHACLGAELQGDCRLEEGVVGSCGAPRTHVMFKLACDM